MKLFSFKKIPIFLLFIFAVGWFLMVALPNLEPYLDHTEIGPFTPTIIDGDTIADGDMKFRISGVDACEIGQPVTFSEYSTPLDCGIYAREFLVRFINGRDVVCFDQGSRSYGRIVARCFVETEDQERSIDTDLGAFILSSGWAFPEQGEPSFAARYAWEHFVALVERRGALNGELIRPADWRRITEG